MTAGRIVTLAHKFEKLEVWKPALEYLDMIYEIADKLPRSEERNTRSQILRAGASILFAIAEGSTGQTNAEQSRFLGIGIRSVIETVACLHVIKRRKLNDDIDLLRRTYRHSQLLFGKLVGMRRAVDPDQKWIREESAEYLVLNEDPWPDE